MATQEDDIKPAVIMENAYAVYQPFAMLAGMQLDLFTPLKGCPMSAEALASKMGVRPEKLAPLLYALVTARLLAVDEGIFSNTPETDKFLVCGGPDYIGGLSGFYNTLWHAALNTAESIRSGNPQSKFDWTSLPEDQLVKYFSSQYPGSLRAGRQLAEKIDFTPFRRLLDAGGGTGGLSIGLCQRYPDLQATVADLPAVASISKRFINEAGLSARITSQAIDLVGGPPRGTWDVAVLRALVQVMSPGQAKRVLANVYRALEPGALMYIVGSVLDDTRLSPRASIAFSLVFLNVYDEGQSYTEQQHREWLSEAGFTDIHVEHEAMIDGLGIVLARKK